MQLIGSVVIDKRLQLVFYKQDIDSEAERDIADNINANFPR